VIAAFEIRRIEMGHAPADFGIPSAAAVGCEGSNLDQAAGRLDSGTGLQNRTRSKSGAEQFIDGERSRNVTENRMFAEM